ncbi:hypothetical protein BY458DRAFT_497172 [Sporodiniella umbellata]|nr:hypothetical protein BY458DRAFT_497172 [Sporodiniella umbellata]
MIKNLGRFKQWTGEKFGGAKATLQTEDFQKLEQETEHRREGYENIVAACDALYQHLLKRKPSPEDNKAKLMPFDSFGNCLNSYGNVFPQESALESMAVLQEELADNIKNRYMNVLENGLQEYKDYDTLRKKLELKRLDYDSKLNRLNKAKKEKPELEQEMQGAKMKYEDTEHELIQKMAYLQEFENAHRDALYNLLDAEVDYHTKAKELLESIRNEWDHNPTQDITAFMAQAPMARIETVTSNKTSPSIKFEKIRKASFDFSGQNDDEISFKIGDLITVIDEIDRGWWVGEANGKRGIFPVNFTEEYDAVSPSSGLTRHSNSSNESIGSPKTIQQTRRTSSIRQRPPPPPPSLSTSSHLPSIHPDLSFKRASSQSIPIVPMTHTVSAPDTLTRHSMPPPPPASLSRHRSTAMRPPPPPPPIRSSTLDRV